MNSNFLIELHDVGKSFRAADGTARHVLEHVDFTLREGEIVALLGKSGSGKSTLLRIMAGLVNADQGTVIYRGQPVCGPAAGIAMVFQSFALFLWLTAQQNVELGLEAQGVAPAERARRADAVLDLMGLGCSGGALPEKNFLDSLEEFLKPDEAERVLKIAVEWGRYGEIYGYDYHTGLLTLPERNAG